MIHLITIFIFFLSWIPVNIYPVDASTIPINLFRISENSKYGFIDSLGNVIIEPIFLDAGVFSEGLTYARTSGKYGYINLAGQFVLPALYDRAANFNNGLAIVYIGDIPSVINKDGSEAFKCNYKEIEDFIQGRAIVRTKSGRRGMINTKGRLVIDTVYSRIFPFINNRAGVWGLNQYKDIDVGGKKKRLFEAGVIDSAGHFIIPFGKYTEIGQLENNYFLAQDLSEVGHPYNGYNFATSILDINGNLVITRVYENKIRIGDVPRCGLIKMNLYKYWIPEEPGIISTSLKDYIGFMNLNGEIFINDTTYKDATSFSSNRAFVTRDRKTYFIINQYGQQIGPPFDGIHQGGFNNGLAVVSENRKWGVIDTNANYIIEPQYYKIHYPGIIDSMFFYSNDNSNEDLNPLIGISHLNGQIILAPKIESFDWQGFNNGLLRCVIDNKDSYINKKGQIVWQEKNNPTSCLAEFNVVYPTGSSYYASSKPKRKARSGGWFVSENYPKRVSKIHDFPLDEISIKVYTELKDTFLTEYWGMPVKVANLTDEKAYFNAQDSRIDMKAQAIDTSGNWSDIEGISNSWCGNSYHQIELEPGYYWSFVTPQYYGDFKTKLRIQLNYLNIRRNKNELSKREMVIYSNVYEGSVNLSQFIKSKL